MAPGIILESAAAGTLDQGYMDGCRLTQTAKHSFPDDADTAAYAKSLDSKDPLRSFRDRFIIPTKRSLKITSLRGAGGVQQQQQQQQQEEVVVKEESRISSTARTSASLDYFQSSPTEDEDAIYFCGNSLGLQPKCVARYIAAQLETWASIGVAGHFTQLGNSPLRPWQSMADFAAQKSCRLVGALEGEVSIANTLTVNLHLLMASFYRPSGPTRRKILLEWKAFPSDHYAIESQIAWHGYDPKDTMILIEPDQDHIISTENILASIDQHADEIALILLPGVQYYTGQLLDIARITAHAHSKGLVIGWDLAHAAGNVPLRLHEWNVDFAAWCTYKYMNAGPGAIAGLFVHERHGKVERAEGSGELVFRHRLTGWYSGDRASRFEMDNKFRPIPGAGGFQISNPSAIDLTSLCASLSVFDETSIQDLREKSVKLTAYLQHLLFKDTAVHDVERPFRLITPLDPSHRGAQLCLLLKPGLLERVAAKLEEAGIVVDKRKPDVIRVAPVPLYNSFYDVWRFVQVFRDAVEL